MSGLVSVAICTYNGGAYLEKQLQSVCDQTYKHLELIICDDGSTDNTIEIVKGFESRLNLKLYINETNLGFIKNFEKAVSYCAGEFIALCDQDDIWLPEKIETLLSNIGDNILIYSDSELIDHEDSPLNKKVSEVLNPLKDNNPVALILNNCAPGNTIFFRKELLRFALPFPEKIFHDWWLLYTAVNVGKIVYIPVVLVKYRQHDSNITNMTFHKEEKEKDNKIVQRERLLYYFKQFQEFNKKHNIKNAVLDKLIQLQSNRSRLPFDARLFKFLLLNRKDLYFVLKKKDYKRIHRIYKECLTYKYRAKSSS